MSREFINRIKKLQSIALAANKDAVWMVQIDNAKIRIKNASNARDVLQYDASTPAEAIKIVEEYIFKKAPVHVNFSYYLDDIFTVYPEYKAMFSEYAPIPVTNYTTGDYYKSLGNLPLKHIILFNHAHTWGQETGYSRIVGFHYTEADFERIYRSEEQLFAVLLDVIQKEQAFYDNADPDTPNLDVQYFLRHPHRMKCGTNHGAA